jgi:hypothetical protein
MNSKLKKQVVAVLERNLRVLVQRSHADEKTPGGRAVAATRRILKQLKLVPVKRYARRRVRVASPWVAPAGWGFSK